MKRIYLFLLIVLFSVLPSVAASYSARIEKIWLEHNVMKDGVQNLVIHLTMEGQGLQNKNGVVVAYVDIPKGVGHRDTNGRYCTTDNKVSASANWSSPYDRPKWDDFKIYLPNNEIHPLSGKNTYYIRAFFWYGKEQLAISEFVSFDMTGSGSAVQQPKPTPQVNKQTTVQQNSNVERKYRRNVTSDSYEDCVEKNNSISVSRYIRCHECRGSGIKRCPLVHSYNTFCIACNNTGSRNCASCNKTGYIAVGHWTENKTSIYQQASEAKAWAKSQRKTQNTVSLNYQDNGGVYFTFTASYTNGMVVNSSCKPCTSCNNGICKFCNGVGYRIYGSFMPNICGSCNGRMKCSQCHGSKCLLTESSMDRNGNRMSKTGGLPDINRIGGSSSSSSKSSSSSSSSKPKKKNLCLMTAGRWGCDGSGKYECATCYFILMDGHYRDKYEYTSHKCGNCGIQHTYYNPKSEVGNLDFLHHCKCRKDWH